MKIDAQLRALHAQMIALASETEDVLWLDTLSRAIWKRERHIDTATGEVTETYFLLRGGEWSEADEPAMSALGYDPHTGYPLERGLRGEMD